MPLVDSARREDAVKACGSSTASSGGIMYWLATRATRYGNCPPEPCLGTELSESHVHAIDCEGVRVGRRSETWRWKQAIKRRLSRAPSHAWQGGVSVAILIEHMEAGKFRRRGGAHVASGLAALISKWGQTPQCLVAGSSTVVMCRSTALQGSRFYMCICICIACLQNERRHRRPACCGHHTGAVSSTVGAWLPGLSCAVPALHAAGRPRHSKQRPPSAAHQRGSASRSASALHAQHEKGCKEGALQAQHAPRRLAIRHKVL